MNFCINILSPVLLIIFACHSHADCVNFAHSADESVQCSSKRMILFVIFLEIILNPCIFSSRKFLLFNITRCIKIFPYSEKKRTMSFILFQSNNAMTSILFQEHLRLEQKTIIKKINKINIEGVLIALDD